MKIYEKIVKKYFVIMGIFILSGIIFFSYETRVYGKEKVCLENLKCISGEYIYSNKNQYCVSYFTNKSTIEFSFNCSLEENTKISNLIVIGSDNNKCGEITYDSRLKNFILKINLNEGDNEIKIKDKEDNSEVAALSVFYKKLEVIGIPKNIAVGDNFNIKCNIDDFKNILGKTDVEWFSYGINTMILNKNGNVTIVNGGEGVAAAMIYDMNNCAIGHIDISICASGKGKYGWIKNNNKWYYIDPMTKCFKVGWIESNSNKYFINDDGEMKVGWLDYKGTRFYLAKDGTMKRGWEKIDGRWYYFNEDGSLRKGWLTYNKDQYYFGEDGVMITGSYYVDGTVLEFDDNGQLI